MKTLRPILFTVLFIALPVLLFFTGDVASRTWLKDGLSLLTVFAFIAMVLQFFLSRANGAGLEGLKMSKVIKYHKVLGYVFVVVLLVHPFLILVPRYFETGVAPSEAFFKMLEQWQNPGLTFGIVAWMLMLLIGITSMFRSRLKMKYTTWRWMHGILSIVFLIAGVVHVIYLGRHISILMSCFIVFLSSIAITLQLRTMIVNK